MTDLDRARALRAEAAQQWDRQLAQSPTSRPTPTRAEATAIAAGDLLLFKGWDGSPVAADAIDALDDNDPPPSPFWLPQICGIPIVGAELHALPGLIGPHHVFRWQRSGRRIPGACGLRYQLSAEDVGAMIGFASLTPTREIALARPVGPVRLAKR